MAKHKEPVYGKMIGWYDDRGNYHVEKPPKKHIKKVWG